MQCAAKALQVVSAPSRPVPEMHVVNKLVVHCNGVVVHRLCSLSLPDSCSVSGEGQTLHVSHSAHCVLPNQRCPRAWSRGLAEVTQE